MHGVGAPCGERMDGMLPTGPDVTQAAPAPLEATSFQFALPGALWLAATRSGAFDALLSVWPAPPKGPPGLHFLFLAAIHRICAPGPTT